MGIVKKTSDKSKIKKEDKGVFKVKKVVTTKLDQQADKQDHKLPTLHSIREDAIIQSKVEQRLQELSKLAKTGTIQKLKSQRGGHIEVMVKNRIKWPHEYILSGLNK